MFAMKHVRFAFLCACALVWAGCGRTSWPAANTANENGDGDEIETSGSAHYADPESSPLVTGASRGFVTSVESQLVRTTDGTIRSVAKDEILLALAKDITPVEYSALLQLLDDLEVFIIGEDGVSRLLQLRVPDEASLTELLPRLESVAGVTSAFLNSRDIGLPGVQVDPDLNASDAGRGLWWIDEIGARDAWDLCDDLDLTPGRTATGIATKLQIIDNGYEDSWTLGVGGYDDQMSGLIRRAFARDVDVTYVASSPGVTFDEPKGYHGTVVAALGAADGASTSPQDATGVAWGSDVTVFDVLGSYADTCDLYYEDAVTCRALQVACQGLPSRSSSAYAPTVVNVSLGPNTTAAAIQEFWALLLNCAEQCRRSDVLIVVAAGNSNWTLDYPLPEPDWSDYEKTEEYFQRLALWRQNFIVVSGSDAAGGLVSWYVKGAAVDLAAPALSVSAGPVFYTECTSIPGFPCLCPFTYDEEPLLEGTSFAAPLVAGTAALVRAINPSLTAEEVRDLLIGTAERDPSLFSDAHLIGLGGRLDAGEAVLHARLSLLSAELLPEAEYRLPYGDSVQHSVETSIPEAVGSDTVDLRIVLKGELVDFVEDPVVSYHNWEDLRAGSTATLDVTFTGRRQEGIHEQEYDGVLRVELRRPDQSWDFATLLQRQFVRIVVPAATFDEPVECEPPHVRYRDASGDLVHGQESEIEVYCGLRDYAHVAEVRVDLSAIGGSRRQLLQQSDNNWEWQGTVTPPRSGRQSIHFTIWYECADGAHPLYRSRAVHVAEGPADPPPQIFGLSVSASPPSSLVQGAASLIHVGAQVVDTDERDERDYEAASVLADLSQLGGSTAQELHNHGYSEALGGPSYWWSWEGDLTPANAGTQTVTLIATDQQGNQSRATRDIYVMEPFEDPPPDFISTEVSGHLTADETSTVQLSCVVTDNRDVVQVVADLSELGVSDTQFLEHVSHTSGIWTATVADVVPLSSGTKMVYITATDDVGHASTETVSVNIATPVERPRPTVFGLYVDGTLDHMTTSRVRVYCQVDDCGLETQTVTADLSDIGGPSALTLERAGGIWSWLGRCSNRLYMGSSEVSPTSSGEKIVRVVAEDTQGGVGTTSVSVSVGEGTVVVLLDDTPVPEFSPEDGATFTDWLDVTIDCAIDGALLVFTTDGSVPSRDHGSEVECGHTIRIYETTTVQAITYASGMSGSDVGEATYTQTIPEVPGGGDISGTSWSSGPFYAASLDLSGTLSIPSASEIRVNIVGETEPGYDYLTINGVRYSGVLDESFFVQANYVEVSFHSDYGINTATGVTVTIVRSDYCRYANDISDCGRCHEPGGW